MFGLNANDLRVCLNRLRLALLKKLLGKTSVIVNMNIYGCIPASFLQSPSTLTYWAQAASLAGIASSDPSLIASSNLALGLKKSQLPLNLCDAIRKSNSESALRAISRSSEDLLSTLRVNTSRLSSLGSAASTSEGLIALEDQERLQLQIHMQMQQLRRHHQQQQHIQHQQEDRHQRSHHQPFSSSSPPPVGNGLAPLQALCESDVSAFRSKSSLDMRKPGSHKTSARDESPASGGLDGNGLKFGISRILSDDFGKTKTEKGEAF
ncbi:hypothetical protein ElyMa_004765700 [Elysia marginata]|uniref:Uncharacterized protein n=1 Tax=Elysia marginata TaxID=1093978 RepID=A0AAV4IF37_9GAST|nr:hypothetical protein ElyMa_004765700 [Elysia marginata]